MLLIKIIYKLFAAIDYKILNSSGLPVSGGERSEFNFLQKIKDAILCDILIIDEILSVGDIRFKKKSANKIKSLFPDCYICNVDGKVIGINTLKLSGTGIEGIGFAIPINSTIDVYNELKTKRRSLLCLLCLLP